MSLNNISKKWGVIQNEVGIVCLILLPLYFSNYIASKVNEYWSSFCKIGFKNFCGSPHLDTSGDIATAFLVIFFLFSLLYTYEPDSNYIPKNEADADYRKNNPKYRFKKISLSLPFIKKIVFVLIFLAWSSLLILEKNLILYGFSAVVLLLVLKSDTLLTKVQDTSKIFEQFIVPFFGIVLGILSLGWLLAEGTILGVNSYYKYGSQLNPYFQKFNIPFVISSPNKTGTEKDPLNLFSEKSDWKLLKYDDEPNLGIKISSSSAWTKPADPTIIEVNNQPPTKKGSLQDANKADFNGDGTQDSYFIGSGEGCVSCHLQLVDILIRDKIYSLALNEGKIYPVENGFYSTNYFIDSEPATCCPNNVVLSRFIWNDKGFIEVGRKTFWISLEITADQAIQKVKDIPEVKSLGQRFETEHKKPLHILIDREEADSWKVHVFEIVEDVPGTRNTHTATYGWYSVDKKSGKIYDDINFKPVSY